MLDSYFTHTLLILYSYVLTGELYRDSLVRTEDAEEEVAEEEIEVMPAGEGDEDAGGVGGMTVPADAAPLLVMQAYSFRLHTLGAIVA